MAQRFLIRCRRWRFAALTVWIVLCIVGQLDRTFAQPPADGPHAIRSLPPLTAVSEIRLREPVESVRPSTNGAAELPSPMQLKSAPVRLGSGPAISLDELTQIAAMNNPTLVKAAAAVEAARGDWVQVGLYPNPSIGYLGNQINDQGTAGQQGFFVEQEFVRGGKRQLSREVVGREIAIAEQQLVAQRARVLNDVRIEFYNALVAQRTLEISQELVGVGERGVKAANDLLAAKETSRVDLLQAEVEVSNTRISLVNAENRYAGAWRRLAALIGVPGMQQTAVQGDLLTDVPYFTWEASVGRILAESPELNASRIDVDRAARALARSRVEAIPNPTVQAGPQYDFAAQQSIANVSVSLPVPVFNYNQGNVRRAEAEVRSARAEVARKELELTTRLASAFERYSNARNQVQRYRDEVLPKAKQALEMVTAGYRAGETSFLMLLTAQRTYFYTNLAYLDGLRELWETSIAIDGLLLTDSLQAESASLRTPPSAAASALPGNAFLGR
jgi:cobalt-zinc-cadmium efflux system outer membrane protein